MYRFLKNNSLYFAWLIALAATVGSLYFSIIRELPVCHLCWYQRICIYPLAIILGIAAYYNDRRIVKYVLPLSLVGFLLGLYQYLWQMMPNMPTILSTCEPGALCQTIHVQLFGFVTLPFLNMLTALGISFFLILGKFSTKAAVTKIPLSREDDVSAG